MMTLSSITADVHELQVRFYYGPCQVQLSQRLYIYSTLASPRTCRNMTGFSWCTNMIFQHTSTVFRLLAASARWCSVSGMNAPAPSGITPYPPVIPDFLFNRYLTG